MDLCPERVPAQSVQHQSDRAVLFHRVCVRGPLVVQYDGGVKAGHQPGLYLVVPGQDLVQADGTFGSPADDGIATYIHGSTDVSGAEGQEGPAVQQKAPGTVILQQSFERAAVHFA